jgi:hypothetical protein
VQYVVNKIFALLVLTLLIKKIILNIIQKILNLHYSLLLKKNKEHKFLLFELTDE